ncbi:MAG: hypothetical protein ABEJ36_04100 [Candidatus Nanosalina sp.]
MHNGVPHGLWLPLLLMIVIILALLWNDRMSESSGGSTGTTTERDPRIQARHGGSQEVGQSFYVQGSYSLGSASSYNDLSAEINGSTVRVEAGGGEFRTEEVNVQEGTNEYEVRISTSVGSDTSSGRFAAQEPGPEPEEGPTVRVTDESISEEEGAVELLAQAEPGDSDTEIEATGFVKVLHQESGYGFQYSDPTGSDYLARGSSYTYQESGLPPGTYHYTAWTIDDNRNTDTYSDSFQIEEVSGPGGDGPRRGGGQPLVIYNPQMLERRAGNLPDELLQVLEALAESIKAASGDEEVTVELGEELEGLVAAVESLSDNLSELDVEQLVEELEAIRREIESNEVDLSTLEGQIEELIETVEEQSGITDEQREFYQKILEKLEDIEEESGSSPELEDLEELVEVTVNPEQSVEVQGLSEEDRALLRQILNEMRSRGLDEAEFRWFVNEFMRQRRNQQRIFRILQYIWMELQEGGDPEGESPEDGVFGFLDDFRTFREFMQRRESDNKDMGPFSASSAFSGAYYSGSISLDHNPVTVMEKISKISRRDKNGEDLGSILDVDISESEMQEVESTVRLYNSIESGSKV